MESIVAIRDMTRQDAAVMADAFNTLGTDKSKKLYLTYLAEQYSGQRQILIAQTHGIFAGYLTIVWDSKYRFFRDQGIPEIMDLNVLPDMQRNGIAGKLMDQAEQLISERSTAAGVGVGLSVDYGPAQIMYIKRGYVPDGRGLHSDGKPVSLGGAVILDHSVALYCTKKLNKSA